MGSFWAHPIWAHPLCTSKSYTQWDIALAGHRMSRCYQDVHDDVHFSKAQPGFRRKADLKQGLNLV